MSDGGSRRKVPHRAGVTSASGLAVRAIVHGRSGAEAAGFLGGVARAQRRIVAELPSASVVAATAAQEALRLTRADAARIEIVDGSELTCLAGAGSDVSALGLRSAFSTDARETVRGIEVRRSVVTAQGFQLAAPLGYRGHGIGLLVVHRGARAFEDVDVNVLQLLAGIAGNALGTAHEYALNDRMASLGRLAAGMAHEISNPLAYVCTNVSHVLEQLAQAEHGQVDLDDLREALEDAQRGAHRISSIVSHLRSYSRSPVDAQQRVDLGAVLRQTVEMAGHEVRSRARLVEHYAVAPPVLGNEVQLGQVFLNLLLNAAQAMPPGRTDGIIEARFLGVVDGAAVVDVTDNGAGIAPEDRARLFEPFFTTKPLGVGTGLGLSISHDVVRAHGGTITVTSDLGRGSTFRVSIPVAPEVASPLERQRRESGQYASRRRRVYVAGDEPDLVTTLSLFLGRRFDVDTSGGRRNELEDLVSGPSYDAVICGPDAAGVELHHEVTRERPELGSRFVFVVGDSRADDRHTDYLSNSGCPVVERSSGVVGIRAAIDKILDPVE